MLTKAQGELKDNDEDESSDSDSEDSEPYGESDNEKEEGNKFLAFADNFSGGFEKSETRRILDSTDTN